ncbi:MAG TPA: sigma-70 family RNA polymerase sigma factor [Ramlibacter sp.]|nr:sigma-70 family RNA polymerase sigma factor [Ramlibacter sp.]
MLSPVATQSSTQPVAARSPVTALAAGRSTDAQDQVLIDRVAAGDLRAFEALYRSYHPRVLRFLSLVTPRAPIVEESLNDTMLAVWHRAATYNRQSKLSTWIFAIAYRVACKALRWQDLPLEDREPDERASDAHGPERHNADRETRAALMRALGQLSHEQRNVLVLTYFHDLPYAEIAQIMDCPVDTVKTRMFHGRRKLRALLSGEPGDWL